MTLVYQFGINGCLIWWQAISCIVLTPLCLWVYRHFVHPDIAFSVTTVLKKYGHVAIMITAINGYMFYFSHRYISITNIALTLVCMVMTFVIMERSIYD